MTTDAQANKIECNGVSDFASEWLRGARACQRGDSCPPGASEHFERGYSYQYQHEQNMMELSRVDHRTTKTAV